MGWTHGDHDHLGVHIALRSVGRAIEVNLQETDECRNGQDFEECPAIWDRGDAVLPQLAKDVDGHVGVNTGRKEPNFGN